MAAAGEQFTLHESVAARWWLVHLPLADEARRFLFNTLSSGQLGLVAPSQLEFRILDLMARDLGPVHADPSISNILFDDKSRQLRQMRDQRILRLVDERPLAREAFSLASLHNFSFVDALTVILAEGAGRPLLLADQDLFTRLQEVRVDRPGLRVLWLPEHDAL